MDGLTLPPEAALVVKRVTIREAHLLPRLLHSVFGTTYFDTSLYEVEGVCAAVEGGSAIFFIVVAGEPSRALGVLAMRFCYPSRAVAELGMLAVDPELSPIASSAVLRALSGALNRVAREMARDVGLRCLVSTEVTVHQLTQRMVAQFGFVCTGMYLGWAPPWAEQLRALPTERKRCKPALAARAMTLRRTETVSVLPFDKMIEPYDVALPSCLAKWLKQLITALRMPVRIVEGLAAQGASSLVETRDLRRSRILLEVTVVGADCSEVVSTRVATLLADAADLVHVALPLTRVDINAMVEMLLHAGLRYAAWLPLYRGHDVIVFQHVCAPMATLTSDDLHSPLAKTLFEDLVQRRAIMGDA